MSSTGFTCWVSPVAINDLIPVHIDVTSDPRQYPSIAKEDLVEYYHRKFARVKPLHLFLLLFRNTEAEELIDRDTIVAIFLC